MKVSWSIAITVSFAFSLIAEERRPNILMIAVDDLRPMLGCYGDSRVKTPHIDQLAESGMLFERAYCNYAKCGASRLSLMTGLLPWNIGVYDHGDKELAKFRERRADAVTMGKWFRGQGYETRSFGKIDHDGWQLDEDWSEPPFPGREREMWEVMPPDDPTGETIIAERTDCPVVQSPDVDDDHLFAGRMTTEVLRVLVEERDQPFFFAVGFRRPHLPFVAPRKYFDLFEPDEAWLAENQAPPQGAPVLAWFNSEGYIGMMNKLGVPMPEPVTREEAILRNGFEMRSYVGARTRGLISKAEQLMLLHAYAACVAYVDAQVGRLLAALDAEGLRENTIVLLWSDHGWHLGEMSAWGKMTNYEIANRVPLIISAPERVPGRTQSFAALVDLYPTLCNLAGIEAPAHLEGVSLVPVLDDPEAIVQSEVFHEYVRKRVDFQGRAVRADRFRYVEWRNRKGEFLEAELYDLENDPDETINRVDGFEEQARELGALIEQRWEH
ncbi:MAG: sulfatase [Verrucomicrobiota bacterium]